LSSPSLVVDHLSPERVLAERIELTMEDGIKTVDLEELFPPKRPFPQRELIEAGERGFRWIRR
jgi:hypothetical protein